MPFTTTRCATRPSRKKMRIQAKAVEITARMKILSPHATPMHVTRMNPARVLGGADLRAEAEESAQPEEHERHSPVEDDDLPDDDTDRGIEQEGLWLLRFLEVAAFP
jgi:hypothetical protein